MRGETKETDHVSNITSFSLSLGYFPRRYLKREYECDFPLEIELLTD